jgi:threonine/homoserine/homoserine lactone efflux protein
VIHKVMVFAGVFAVSAAAPGADTMLILARSVAGGPRAAAPLAAGITIAKLVMLTAAAAGVSAAAATLGTMFVVLKIAGTAYLVWLGVRMWRRRSPAEAPPVGASTKVGPSRAAATGVALGLSNPQAIVFYVALLPAVITPGTGAGVYVILAVVLCVVMAAVSAVYITLGSRARHTAVSPTARRRANRVAGGLLISSGVLVAIR